jgi:hypothetical protein
MAKRKGTKRGKSMAPKRRKKSMGSVNTPMIQKAGLNVLGLVASRFAVNGLSKLIPQLKTPVNKAFAQIALGFLTKPVAGLLGSKSPNVDSFATGMMIGGAYELVKVAVPAALGQAENDGEDVIVVSGMDIAEVNGMDDIGMDISEINGMDEIGMYEDDDTF